MKCKKPCGGKGKTFNEFSKCLPMHAEFAEACSPKNSICQWRRSPRHFAIVRPVGRPVTRRSRLRRPTFCARSRALGVVRLLPFIPNGAEESTLSNFNLRRQFVVILTETSSTKLTTSPVVMNRPQDRVFALSKSSNTSLVLHRTACGVAISKITKASNGYFRYNISSFIHIFIAALT
ncbi:hypothetical protein BDN70DRAFT_706769 [Pholiota conissans]|uniref:Uncharacterized protein n=1 Tax=Pholiota conissans TaxID=109636 RepID=A0A9P6D6V5_9AGAR|nr:hypothetical protein BDN70DRAFT_706769 [Pholiota conissans]